MAIHDYRLSQLGQLESEAVFIMREVVAQLERPATVMAFGSSVAR